MSIELLSEMIIELCRQDRMPEERKNRMNKASKSGNGNSIRFFAQKAGRIMLSLILIPIVAIVVLAGAVLIASMPGKPYPILNKQGNLISGSISEKIFVEINGVTQGMFIKSKNTNNPVLLFIHGGPGFPEYWLTHRYPTGLEDDFTVVWWDQRGSGLSYSPDIPPETMNYEQFISDTVEVTNYLRQRFGKEKIYLMAHSGGTVFGIQVAARHPEFYYAYIGMGQIVHQLESEQLAYQYALEQYKANGNTRMYQKLIAAPPTSTMPLPPAYDSLRDEYMHDLGIGTTRDMDSVITHIFFPSWLSRELTLREKVNLWRGKMFSAKMLRDTVFSMDLPQEVTEMDIPVYFFSGAYDYTCNYSLSREYLEQLNAPLKGFYLFQNSAHTPIFEEPEKVRSILQEDVLNATNTLADVK
jgi:pimeloyl-ACP methyl ester carboxylesterase